MQHPKFARTGFTVIEVMVALAIGAIVLLGAREILEQIADTSDHMTAATRTTDRTANTERAVRALIARTTAADDTNPFTGTISTAHFTTWCDVPAGWEERCTATIDIAPPAVLVRTSIGDVFHLYDTITHAELRYLITAANGGQWSVAWLPGMTTPIAIGIITPHDTMVLRLGERR